jgi:carboxymethylenebutenolidase
MEIQIALKNNSASTYFAARKSGAAVLVLHAWWGLNDFFKRLCDRLADEGFVALAPDLYQGRTANTIQDAEALLEQRDSALMEETALAAAKLLREHPMNTAGKIGVIGFSMGAAWATYLATKAATEDIAACVFFYGVGESDMNESHASFLGHFAVGDEWESDEYIRHVEDSIRKANLDVMFHHYDGVKHWFMEDNRPEFDADTAKLAWERTIRFLNKTLEN